MKNAATWIVVLITVGAAGPVGAQSWPARPVRIIMLLAHPSLPVNNVQDVIALAKARPGELTNCSFGAGSSSHFAGALLMHETMTKMVHVPYKGGGPVAAANVAGEAPIHYGGVPPTIGFIKAGRLKPLAVTAAKRTVFLPEVPTIAEALKIRDYDITVTFGMLAPAGTPKPFVDRLHAELSRIVSSPDFKATFTKLGMDETPVMSLADLGAWLRNETARWRRIIELTGIRAD